MLSRMTARSFAAASIVSICAAFGANAEEAVVKEVTAKVGIESTQDANVLDYYPQMQADLEAAIRERVPVADDPAGYVVDVILQDVSLNGDSMLPSSMEFNQMEGVVTITSPATNATPQTVPINLRAMAADGTAPEGFIVVPPSEADFYRALIASFADAVADELPKYMRETAK
ncbi:hypothetical protein I5535_14980 [Rhodobacteraceae bacterium F11138]|nr:hypothetical protein [Rhodobacteraceae bacterium F11138]